MNGGVGYTQRNKIWSWSKKDEKLKIKREIYENLKKQQEICLNLKLNIVI